MERRRHTRFTLKHPIPCMCIIGRGQPIRGFIKNISLRGVMLSIPDLEDGLMVECQRISVETTDDNGCSLGLEAAGMMSWIYKKYIGVNFDSPLAPEEAILSHWLAETEQLCETVH